MGFQAARHREELEIPKQKETSVEGISKERSYKDVLEDALRGVKQELMILVDGKPFITYIHDLQVVDNKIHIDWSTPHDETEIDRDELFHCVQQAINVQLTEGLQCQTKSAKPSSRTSSIMKSIFGKLFRS